MNEKTMEWIPVYEQQEENERPVVIGYECCECGYFSRTRWGRCPFCKRREEEPCEDMHHDKT